MVVVAHRIIESPQVPFTGIRDLLGWGLTLGLTLGLGLGLDNFWQWKAFRTLGLSMVRGGIVILLTYLFNLRIIKVGSMVVNVK